MDVRVLHTLPGRLRLGLSSSSARLAEIAAAVAALPGVHEAAANPLTGNLLVRFDPSRVGRERILSTARSPVARRSGHPDATGPVPPASPLHRLASSTSSPPSGAAAPMAREAGSRAGARPASDGSHVPWATLARHLATYLPRALMVVVSALTAGGPIGLTMAGLDGLQLAAEILVASGLA